MLRLRVVELTSNHVNQNFTNKNARVISPCVWFTCKRFHLHHKVGVTVGVVYKGSRRAPTLPRIARTSPMDLPPSFPLSTYLLYTLSHNLSRGFYFFNCKQIVNAPGPLWGQAALRFPPFQGDCRFHQMTLRYYHLWLCRYLLRVC